MGTSDDSSLSDGVVLDDGKLRKTLTLRITLFRRCPSKTSDVQIHVF